MVVIDEQGREVEEREKKMEKKELERRERELQRKEGERNKENCLNSNEVIFCNLQRTVAGPSDRTKVMRTKGKLNGRLQKLHVEAKLILLKRKLRTRIKNLDFNVTKFTIYLMIIVFILCNCFIFVKKYASTCFLGVTYTTHSHVHFSNLDSFRV